MNNNIQIFQNQDFGEIRTISQNSTAYFCLIDVCRILDIKNPSDAKKRLRGDGVATTDLTDSLGRKQPTNFIDESNLYKLVFQSRKPEAERFTDWVTSEVLPSIRKHGAYMTDDVLEEALLNPDYIIKLATKLKEERLARLKVEEEIERNRPKVLFADAVSASHTSILVGDLAKLLKQNGIDIGANRLFERLRNDGYLIKNGESRNMPTQRAMEMKLFEVKERTINNPDGSIRITKTPKVTGKGQQYFVNYFLKHETQLVLN